MSRPVSSAPRRAAYAHAATAPAKEDVRAEDRAERDVREKVVLRPRERGGTPDEDREAGEDEGGLAADGGAECPTAHRADEGNELDVHALLSSWTVDAGPSGHFAKLSIKDGDFKTLILFVR